MMTKSIKDMVAGKSVTFMYYCQKELWYTTECGFEFPVPIEDCGEAKWLPKDKAIYFMRYINQHMKMIKSAQTEQPA